jgi:predicted signal transduction protein with EAL and GGDEF domain
LFTAPLVIEDFNIEISTRMGIATYPMDALDSESLFKNAELALKEAKYTKLKYLYYSPEFNDRMAEKIALER